MLKIIKAMLLVGVGVILIGNLCAGDEKKDKEKLQGNWDVVSAVVDGRESKEEGAKKIVFSGNQVRMSRADEESLRFVLDPTKKPATFDLYKKFGDGEKGPIKGIYSLDGDTLKLCLARLPGDDRPKDFSSPVKGPPLMLITLKRSK